MEDAYLCSDCGHLTLAYNELWHPNETEGGFCPLCKGDVFSYDEMEFGETEC